MYATSTKRININHLTGSIKKKRASCILRSCFEFILRIRFLCFFREKN